ncbi:MAG: hypothetical protein Q4G02_00800 [bacterium]|nr:hypothetical protein [bacterium]
MKIFSYRHSAQAGIIAIIVTTVLFALGLSVSNQVTKEVVENIEREESTQALNAAEGGLETGGDNSTVQVTSSIADESSILLSEGDSVEMAIPSTGSLEIMWELTSSDPNDHPALLLSHYKGTDSNTTVDYYPLACNDCDVANGKYTGYTKAVGGTNPYRNKCQIALSNTETSPHQITLSDGGYIRIKALFNNTYLKIPGLVNVTRSAAKDSSTEQARVVELRQTTPAAPAVMDYALFAGSGDISAQQ